MMIIGRKIFTFIGTHHVGNDIRDRRTGRSMNTDGHRFGYIDNSPIGFVVVVLEFHTSKITRMSFLVQKRFSSMLLRNEFEFFLFRLKMSLVYTFSNTQRLLPWTNYMRRK
jgi:hypothetical protein